MEDEMKHREDRDKKHRSVGDAVNRRDRRIGRMMITRICWEG